MKSKIMLAATLSIAFIVTSCGLIPTQTDSAITAVNVDESRLAIKGYDPVAYFTLAAPTKGNSAYAAEHEGATYLFSSAKNKNMFTSNPNKYIPQYGGYCAFGVAMEKKFDADPEAWAVIDDKLYLNLNKKVQSRWLKDSDGYIETASANWIKIGETSADKL